MHGRRVDYLGGCRCEQCRAAQAEYMRAYYKRPEALAARRLLRARQRAERQSTGLAANEWDESRRAAYQKRRAQKKSNAHADKVLASKVYTRDLWVCGICSEPIDQTLTYPDRMSASLDHVVPLSLGGEHSLANTRAAHLSCNVKRGNRVA